MFEGVYEGQGRFIQELESYYIPVEAYERLGLDSEHDDVVSMGICGIALFI